MFDKSAMEKYTIFIGYFTDVDICILAFSENSIFLRNVYVVRIYHKIRIKLRIDFLLLRKMVMR